MPNEYVASKATIKWFEGLTEGVAASAQLALNELGQLMVSSIKASMKKGTGRYWPSKKRDGTKHQASVPGKPPAPDTKQLKDSIRYMVDKNPRTGRRTLVVGTDIPYGKYLELGAPRVGVRPRPFLRPAFERHKDKILFLMKKYWGVSVAGFNKTDINKTYNPRSYFYRDSSSHGALFGFGEE